MPARLSRHARLVSHPGSVSDAVSGLTAEVMLAADQLSVAFLLRGEMGRLRIPAPDPAPGRRDELWRHTCFEAFLMRPPGSGYLELNFSPSGHWAAYAFDSYRSGMRAAEPRSAPRVQVTRTAGELHLQASLRLPVDVAADAAQPLGLALTAVVEDAGGSLYYWSLRHPAGKPDFHHSDNYLLELTA